MENTIPVKMKEFPLSCRSFQFGDDPELIHIIKTGFKDRYMIVHEDAYEFMLGKVEFATQQEIMDRFEIDLSTPPETKNNNG